MRLWENEQPNEPKEPTSREYETVGYVISGRAELHIEGQMVLLEPGTSWVVPKGASHTYKILESFTAVEATSPPTKSMEGKRIKELVKKADGSWQMACNMVKASTHYSPLFALSQERRRNVQGTR